MSKERVLGLMGVGSYSSRRFSERDVKLLGAIANQIGMAIDNAQLYEQALELAFTDGLTGLYNRRYLMEQIEREFNRVERSDGSLSLMMIDLDGLKGINDRFGHHEGDSVLRGLGSIIKANTRASDVAARWGGDEFMLLTPETTSNGARRIGERIRTQVEQYRPKMDGEEVAISISVGIALYPGHASDVTQLLQRVDEAMYQAKRGGRNQLCVFSS
jgi:diguanylate cyclase (GGDEF)-like protein